MIFAKIIFLASDKLNLIYLKNPKLFAAILKKFYFTLLKEESNIFYQDIYFHIFFQNTFF